MGSNENEAVLAFYIPKTFTLTYLLMGGRGIAGNSALIKWVDKHYTR